MNRLMLATMIALLAWTAGATAEAGVNIASKPLSMSTGQPPNILLIPDTSESMQEGVNGRVALDWDDPDCRPGPNLDSDECPAGARNPESKASIVKRVGQNLVTNYSELVNMGLLSYQQNPPSRTRNDFNSGGTVRWRLVERAVDVRYSTNQNPSWYDPDFEGEWNADTKRYRAQHPTNDNIWIFFNDAIPGYFWDSDQDGNTGVPEFDRTEFRRYTGQTVEDNPPDGFRNHRYANIRQTPPTGAQDGDSGLYYVNHQGTIDTYLVDSLRQRGITSWGERAVFFQLNQLEWRTTTSPGRGYLHVPIRGLTGDSDANEAHWEAIGKKLEPQRHDWNPNAMTDPDWPLIAAGLTPLEGTMQTARRYFLGQGASESSEFGPDQGWHEDLPPIPESCDVNAAVWVTDGLPSVAADGTSLGDDPGTAISNAVAAVSSFHEATGAEVYIVGFALPPGVSSLPGVPDDPLGALALAGGTETALMADNEEALNDAMDAIFQQIIADAHAEFGSIDSGAVLRSGNLAFRTMADPADWSGDVYGVRNPDGNEQVVWRASEQMPDDRNLITYGGGFDTGNNALIDALHEEEDVAAAIVNYIHGDPLLEQVNGGPFQDRSSLIGTVVGSQPALQRPVNHAWDRLPEGEPGAGTYNSHVESKFNRRDVVYVGSNAGVLHALDAETGEELFGYVPRGVWPRLIDVAEPAPDFVYTVDGSVVVTDAYLPGRGGWRTVLVGSLGAGGQSIFAIDVTNPQTVNESSVLWEVTADDLPDSGDLGYTFATPKVARLENGSFAAVVGNGYGSNNNDSRLLVFDLANGNLLGNMLGATGTDNSPNGLSTPRVARERPHEYYDRWVYAGDLHGNLWRFDLNNLAGSGQLVFSGDRPITAPPQTSYPRSSDGFVVSFGTGKFFEVGDNVAAGAPNEYFYLIHDLDPEVGALSLGQGDLVNRSFGGASTGEQDNIDPEEDKGWYVNLGGGARMLFQPRVVSGMVLFSSFRPSEEVCSVGGENEAYLLQVASGEGAFAPGAIGRQSGIEGAPARPGFTVREREAVDEDTGEVIVDPDTGEALMVPEIVVRVGDEEIVVEGAEIDELAADLAGGRRSNWLQLR